MLLGAFFSLLSIASKVGQQENEEKNRTWRRGGGRRRGKVMCLVPKIN